MLRDPSELYAQFDRFAVGAVVGLAREQSEVHFIKVKGHLHEELAKKVGVTDEDLAPGETYQDLGNVRADELATRAMWSGEHSGYNLT